MTYLARHQEQAGLVGEDRGWHRLSLGGDRNEPGCVRTGLCAWHKLKGEKTAKRTGKKRLKGQALQTVTRDQSTAQKAVVG